MAVLSCQLTLANGLAFVSQIKSQGFLSLSQSSFTNCNLISYGLAVQPVAMPSQSYLIAIALLSISQGNYQNYLSSFARIFGINASQSLTHLHIKKEDLVSFGLSTKSQNTAESLLIALLQQVRKNEGNSLLSNVYIQLFVIGFEKGINPKVIFYLVVKLFVKIKYDNSLIPVFDGSMLNYSTIVSPDDFN